MRLPKRGEKGFTLIELLIVVAILGVLAAVVIPNVSRFIGSGESEAADTEFANIQAAISSMMIDNEISVLPNPVGTATSDMAAFPDSTSVAGSADKLTDVAGTTYIDAADPLGDKNGFILYTHDRVAGDDQVALTNYTNTDTTNGTYTVVADGTVTQVTTGYE